MLSAEQSAKRIDVLDGMRGMAILLVLAFHLWQLSWIELGFAQFVATVGFVGVELFFFISGFCLALPYLKANLFHLPPPGWKEFYLRRVIKILPSYWLALLTVTLFLRTPFADPGLRWKHAMQHFFFIHSWFYPPHVAINGVLWSLDVEVQFYLLFPFLIAAFIKNPVHVFSGVLIAASAIRFWVQGLNPHGADLKNTLPAVIDLFFGGMLAAYFTLRPDSLVSRITRRYGVLILFMSSAAFLGICYWGFKWRYHALSAWQLQSRPFLILCFFAFAMAANSASNTWRKVIANPVLVFFSAISYNLYLWHQYLATEFFRRRIPASPFADLHHDSDWQLQFVILCLFSSIALATLLTLCWERPIIRKAQKSPLLQGLI